jgi:hypothetical protein
MRCALLALPLLLAACDGPGLVVFGGVNVASLALTGRTPPDILTSLATGRSCSVARLDRGETYCAPADPGFAPPPHCTRSLGSVDCWATPPASIPLQAGVAQQPEPTAEQRRRAEGRWPFNL